ncbi:MAG: ATP-binding protein [Pseudomonadota bacterium]|nr:ATP-binding protein [Pseudomonadota bacterium]
MPEYDQIWRISKDILAVAATDGRILSVNNAIIQVLGWDEKQAPLSLLDLVHADSAAYFSKALEGFRSGAEHMSIDIKAYHRDGSHRWMSWTISRENDELYAIGRDITDSYRLRQERLSATEQRLQLALEVGGIGAWEWDLRTGQVIWWPGMDKVHGLPPGTGMENVADYVNFVHPEDHAIVAESLRYGPGSNYSDPKEYRVVWPDGSIHWIEARGQVFLDDQSEPYLLTGMCVDITDRKVTEQNLRFVAHVSAELAELVDHEQTLKKVAQLAVPSFADWCTVDMLNDSGTLNRVAVTHIDPDKVALAHKLYEQYPPDVKATSGTWEIIRTGSAELVAEITDEMLAASIEDATYLSTVRQLGLRSYIGVPLAVRGKVLGVITFITAEGRRVYSATDMALAEDIGRRAAVAIENSILYRSLVEADRRKDDFLAMLAHELRNPLAPVRAAADLLQLPLSAEALKKTSAVISRQVDHMAGLVDDLLDVSRVTRGRVEIDNARVDLKQAVASAVEQVRPRMEAKLHRFTLEMGAGTFFVDGDQKRLIQIITNLLDNAAKYTPDQGNVELAVVKNGHEIEITVTDNGVGMDAQLVTSAFELFVQGERGADRSQGGLGLGLALVRSLVELHNGSVTGHSAGAGTGSTFVVRLPAAENEPSLTNQPRLTVENGKSDRPLRILIVDDNVDAAEMLELYIQAMGHSVIVRHRPSEALKECREHEFDMVLLDIGLPEMDGYQLAKEIQATVPNPLPTLVAVSGYGQERDQAKATAAGIEHYLVKPVDSEKLNALIQNLAKNGSRSRSR